MLPMLTVVGYISQDKKSIIRGQSYINIASKENEISSAPHIRSGRTFRWEVHPS